ncbi:unnamed protein product, partial [Prunus brigantina]
MSRLHDVFHVSMLRKYIPDPSHVLEEQPIELAREPNLRGATSPDFGLEDTSVTNERDPTSEGLVEKSQCGRGYMGTRGPNAG